MNVDGADEAGWDVDPEDETQALVEAVGRQLKLWREAAGLRPAEFGAALGYGENLIYKIERGARTPARSSSTRQTKYWEQAARSPR